MDILKERVINIKKIIFKATHVNYGLCSYDEWQETNYTIFEDLTANVVERYGDNLSECRYKISKKNYILLNKLIEDAKHNKDTVEANDGDAWGFKYYKEGKLYWNRKTDYIYGIKVLESIIDILFNMKLIVPLCPNCGQKMIEIIYGMVPYDIGKKAEEGKVFLGGCVIDEYIPPIYHCNNCQRSYYYNLIDYIEEENNFSEEE